MAIPIIHSWEEYFHDDRNEGLGSTYERIVLNGKLESIKEKHGIETVLEAPSFGFTGLTGINSLKMAQLGCKVSILDHSKTRVELIKSIWKETKQDADIRYIKNYGRLPYDGQSFDMSWNFSAIWFVEDLKLFLREMSRVTSKVIMICVPNKSGLGYLTQKYTGTENLQKYLREDYISTKIISSSMRNLGWKLVDKDFIDCPPWPDIGMPKDRFLAKYRLRKIGLSNKRESLTIMNYYLGKDDKLPKRMMRYYWFERYTPFFIKAIWAHHIYLLFVRKQGINYSNKT